MFQVSDVWPSLAITCGSCKLHDSSRQKRTHDKTSTPGTGRHACSCRDWEVYHSTAASRLTPILPPRAPLALSTSTCLGDTTPTLIPDNTRNGEVQPVPRQRYAYVTHVTATSARPLGLMEAAGTAIAPFLPVPPAPASFLWTPLSIFICLVRLPFLIGVSFIYFVFLEWISIGHVIKYIALWLMLGIPGVWWVDLQVDGVRRGYVTLLHGVEA
jgi:hypothetical protein